jgi:Cu(I)/Ag(I) efflux system membrane fusion protein
MKLHILTLATLAAVGTLVLPAPLLAQNHDHSNMSSAVSAEKTEDYVCPMHPHIHGEAGDTCPICGMELVPAKVDEAPPVDSALSEEDLEGSHRIDPSLVQTIGIKTAPVKLEVFGDDIRAYGRVVPSTRVESKVTLRVEGWVEDLAASALGDPIQKGDRLFNLNSPQLISAQTDYLMARKLGNEDIAQAAASRLKQLGVDDKAMALIRKQSEAMTAVPFHAAAPGVITMLNIRAGDYIKPGMPLLSIQDLSTIWVEADVPERDILSLKEGTRVMVNLPEVGKKRLGKITYIQPTVDPQTRTGEVRIELSNPDGTLKPDSFVDVTFTAEKRHRLAVPLQAVLRSSMGDYVLRWLGDGRFKPVMVSTGARSNEFVEIRKGLKQGQEIVSSGQFLLDAEANLKSGMGSMGGHNHGGGEMKDGETSDEEPAQGGNPHAGH